MSNSNDGFHFRFSGGQKPLVEFFTGLIDFDGLHGTQVKELPDAGEIAIHPAP